jgi:hypothetical protein
MDSEGSAIPAHAASLGSALGQRSTTAHVLVVASPNAQPALQALLRNAGYDALCVEDPYAALLELLVKPMVYRAVVLSLQGLYREELSVIRTLRARLSHVEVWLAHTDGRHAAMAEAVRLGAGGILSDEGLHRLDEPSAAPLDAPTASTLNARAKLIGDGAAQPIAPAAPSAHSFAAADEEHRAAHDGPSASSSHDDVANAYDDAPPVSLAPELPDSLVSGEPILSAEELSALLADPEPTTHHGNAERGTP